MLLVGTQGSPPSSFRPGLPGFSAAPVLCDGTVPGGADGTHTGVPQPHKQELTARGPRLGDIVPGTARELGLPQTLPGRKNELALNALNQLTQAHQGQV